MTVRNLQEQDRNELLTLMVEFYNSPALIHHTPKHVLEKVIDDCLVGSPYVECFVIDDEGSIAGYTIVSKGYSTEYGGISIMIEDIFVARNHRKKGYGKALLQFVESKFEGSAVRLRLEVEKSNENAILLYKRCGFDTIDYMQMGKLY